MRVLVVGHLTLDTICNRQSGTVHFDIPQGAALGSAAGAYTAGADVHLLAVVGSDYPVGASTLLSRAGINMRLIRHDIPTLRFWILRESEQYCVDYPYQTTPIAAYTPPLLDIDGCEVDRFDGAHICPMPVNDQLAWASRLRGIVDVISVDPQPLRFSEDRASAVALLAKLFRLVDILSISHDDFPSMMSADLGESMRNLLSLGSAIVTLKLGARGSAVGVEHNSTFILAHAIDTTVRDETGAGDSYAGAFLTSYLRTNNIATAASRATAAASVMIEQVGMLHLLDNVNRIADVAKSVTISKATFTNDA